jgi:hypothetical protein
MEAWYVVTLKEQFIKKNKWDIPCWHRKNNLPISYFSNILGKKIALCIYGEYAKRQKVLKLKGQ